MAGRGEAAALTRRWSRRTARESGGVGSVLWPKINALGAQEGVVNLGQGFPDFDSAPLARECATAALGDPRKNQYAPVGGLPQLKQAVADLAARQFPDARRPDPATEVCVVTSGTEAIFAAMQALINEGDEVLLFEPAFPWYLPCIRMAGGVPVSVELRAPHFAIPPLEELKKYCSPRLKLVIFNTPHNPTGHVAGPRELQTVAQLCREHDLICLADEVYEACAFPGSGKRHRRIADEQGMGDRTLTMGGASKLLSLTGWRVGWVTGPADLITGLRAAQSYMTYSAPTPLQHGCAAAINSAVAPGGDLSFGGLGSRFEGNWRLLEAALTGQGVSVCPAEGGYFLVADVSSTGLDDWEYCQWLARERRVAAVPMTIFYSPPPQGAPQPRRTLVRFAICKQRAVIEEAARRLRSPFSSARL
eukprot:TRINITY_DN70474_c0_g1_i1.p1 TRINITY_DN70474_c0_g1~~TRINITY_DN70474_c0_g1_i1.p1  ORF type:complete len:444 (+),score=142.04 TRINITY_DN70474_c0_g1_i1:76-1332(+)